MNAHTNCFRFVMASLVLFGPSAQAQVSVTPPNRPALLPEMNLTERLDYAARFDDSSDDKKTIKDPGTIWQGIETSGWPDALANFQHRFQPGHSYLALYEKIPRWPIDMRSPDRFKRSMSAQELANKSSIGHLAVGWSCAQPNVDPNTRTEGFAAQTGEDGQQPEMLNNGWGVTALISTFTDGRIQNGGEVQRYFASGYRKHMEHGNSDNFFALVVEVPTAECENVREFVKTYIFHPAKPYRNFGMLPDPLKFEGAGCGSFAIAALSLAPTLAPLMSPNWRTLPVAEKLLGKRTRVHLPNNVIPYVYAKSEQEEYDISKYRLILMNWDSGATALNVRLVDPELTIYSFRKFAEIATSVSSSPTQSNTTSFQAEHLAPLKRFIGFEIDESFDSSFKDVSSSVHQWWNARAHSSQINLISFPFGVGVMVETMSQ